MYTCSVSLQQSETQGALHKENVSLVNPVLAEVY